MSETHQIAGAPRGEPLAAGRVGARVRVPLTGAPSPRWSRALCGHLATSSPAMPPSAISASARWCRAATSCSRAWRRARRGPSEPAWSALSPRPTRRPTPRQPRVGEHAAGGSGLDRRAGQRRPAAVRLAPLVARGGGCHASWHVPARPPRRARLTRPLGAVARPARGRLHRRRRARDADDHRRDVRRARPRAPDAAQPAVGGRGALRPPRPQPAAAHARARPGRRHRAPARDGAAPRARRGADPDRHDHRHDGGDQGAPVRPQLPPRPLVRGALEVAVDGRGARARATRPCPSTGSASATSCATATTASRSPATTAARRSRPTSSSCSRPPLSGSGPACRPARADRGRSRPRRACGCSRARRALPIE